MGTKKVLELDLPFEKKEAKIVVQKNPFVQRVEDSLVRLNSLKSHRMDKYWKFKNEYAQKEIKVKTEDGYANYHMNTWFALVNSKAADIITNTPKFDFVALDDEAKKYKRIRELHWQYIWATSRTDAEIIKIIQDALKYWVWFWEESIVSKSRQIKAPYKKEDWTIWYKEEMINEYEGCKLSHIPYAQVYVNWSNIENTTEAIIISYWDRDEFLLTFGNNKRYTWVTDELIPKWKYYYIWQGDSNISIDWNPWTTSRADNSVESSNIVSVLSFYNKYRDEFGLIANWRWINPIDWNIENQAQSNIQPIPYPHKEIPLVLYTDHQLDDDIYGLWELDITEQSRQLKDDIRSLHIEAIKAQWGIITIDPDSDYDEAVMKLWVRQIARVAKNGISFFAPQINTQSLIQMWQLVDEELIVETWVDFKNQLFGQKETARKTEWRIEAAKKRINHNIKNNAYTFYERLWRLRSANIDFFYSDRSETLPVKGIEVSEDGTIEYIQNWYGLFTMKPEYFKGKISLIPIVDSLYWDTSNDKKQKYLEALQLMQNMRDNNWAPVFDPKLLIEAGRWIIDSVIDIDKVMGKSKDSKTPDEIMKDAWLWTPSQIPDQGMEAWGIPPAQRSAAPILLGSSPNQ